jgi:uncharacterized membrane protein YeaQ/YmgE (transglycosylase-associated protein family)
MASARWAYASLACRRSTTSIYAGASAGTVTQEGGYDLVGDIIAGIIGALLGGLVGLAPAWHTFVDVILKTFIGACLLSGLKIALVYAVRGTRPHLPLSDARRGWTALLLTPLICFGLLLSSSCCLAAANDGEL